jgi:hypothetical protein
MNHVEAFVAALAAAYPDVKLLVNHADGLAGQG